MYLEASFNFTIIHKDLPQYEEDGGFFKYLPNGTPGFLPAITNADDFIYDNYETYASGDTKVPNAVIRLNPNDVPRVRGVDVTQGLTTLSKGIINQITLKPKAPTPPPPLSRSQQAKADAAFLSDPLGINAVQQQQAQDPLGLNRFKK